MSAALDARQVRTNFWHTSIYRTDENLLKRRAAALEEAIFFHRIGIADELGYAGPSVQNYFLNEHRRRVEPERFFG